MATMTNGEQYEKTIVFGGITHSQFRSAEEQLKKAQAKKDQQTPKEGKNTLSSNRV